MNNFRDDADLLRTLAEALESGAPLKGLADLLQRPKVTRDQAEAAAVLLLETFVFRPYGRLALAVKRALVGTWEFCMGRENKTPPVVFELIRVVFYESFSYRVRREKAFIPVRGLGDSSVTDEEGIWFPLLIEDKIQLAFFLYDGKYGLHPQLRLEPGALHHGGFSLTKISGGPEMLPRALR